MVNIGGSFMVKPHRGAPERSRVLTRAAKAHRGKSPRRVFSAIVPRTIGRVAARRASALRVVSSVQRADRRARKCDGHRRARQCTSHRGEEVCDVGGFAIRAPRASRNRARGQGPRSRRAAQRSAIRNALARTPKSSGRYNCEDAVVHPRTGSKKRGLGKILFPRSKVGRNDRGGIRDPQSVCEAGFGWRTSPKL